MVPSNDHKYDWPSYIPPSFPHLGNLLRMESSHVQFGRHHVHEALQRARVQVRVSRGRRGGGRGYGAEVRGEYLVARWSRRRR